MLPLELVNVTRLAALVIGTETTDFPVVKGFIANLVSPKTRSQVFQRRHRTTRKHLPPNSTEQEVISLWHELTGVWLEVPPGKQHPPEWVWQPSGWNLVPINAERKRRARQASRARRQDQAQ